MKNHNSHLILESNSSLTHKYENDENGNIKVDTKDNDNSLYNIFVEQNKKLNIKDILNENNNLFIKEFEKNLLPEEIPSSPNKEKKKKKVIKTELSTKDGAYRFDINQIKPCFNEIDIKYNRDFDPDFSGEIDDRKNKSIKSDNKDEKNDNNNINDIKSDLPMLKDILEYDEKSNNLNNSNQDNIEENYNNVNSEMNNEEEKLNQKSSEHSESNINTEENNEQNSLNENSNQNLDEKIKDNSEQNNQNDINNSQEPSKDKFLNEQELPQNIDKENNDLNKNIKPKIINKYKNKNNFRHTQPYVGDVLKKFKEKNENKAIKINERKTVPNIDVKYIQRKNEMEQGNNNININNNTDRDKIQNISQKEINDKKDKSEQNIDKESDIKLLKEKIIYTDNENKNEQKNGEYININTNNNLNNENIILKSNPENAESENIITTNINNDSNNEIKKEINNDKEEEINDIFDEFKQPLEENPLNLSYKTEPKNSKIKNKDENNKKRNTFSYGFNIKKKNKNININQNSDKYLDIHSMNGKRDNNAQNNKDIQSNNSEINKNNIKDKFENNEINKADDKNIIMNSQKSKELDLPIEENKGDNVNNNNANKSYSNNVINNFDNNTKEKVDVNSNNNNNSNGNIKKEFKNKIENKSNSNINNNIASNSNNYINQKMNLSFDLSKNLQNEDLNNNLNLINKNSTNIFSNNNNNISLQNISQIKKNEQIENDDNIPLLINKINENQNEHQINDNININSTRILFQNNKEKNNNDINNEIKISIEKNEEIKGENNIARSENDNSPINTKIIKDKSNEENNFFDREEEKERIDTEEFLENNLEKSQNENLTDINKNKNNINDNNTNSKYNSNESDNDNNNDNESNKSKFERIFVKQILPIKYIYKTRHKEITINKLIPKKKRVFITKNKGKTKEKEKEILLPQTTICLMTHQYIIPRKYHLFTQIINKNCFLTKLTINDSIKDKKEKTLNKNNMPKVYKRIKITPGKKSLYYIKHKNKNNIFENLLNINKRGSSLDINFNKDKNKNKNKTEKISVVSKDKDKDIDDNTSSKADDNNNINNKKIKGRNIIIKKDNKILHQFIDDGNNNNIDITIELSDEKPKDFLFGTSLRRFPFTTKNKIIKKNLKESLYKDLQEINNKLRNKDDYLKKHFHAPYQKHVGDMSTCPVCLEMEKKGIHAEKEKGLLKILTSRNLKNINGRNQSKMKIALNRNGKENNSLNIFGANNIGDDFNNKYLQFNGFNRLNRYGSFENLFSYRNDNKKRNSRKINLFKNKEMDKNRDDFDRWHFSALGQYFKKLY